MAHLLDDGTTITAAATVERLLRVPSAHRRFTEPERTATAFHRIPPPLLEELLDAGMPHHGTAGRRRFHRKDLMNVSLRHRLPSPQRRALQNLAWAFRDRDGPGTVRRVVDVRAQCPDPGHAGPCVLRPAPGLVHGPAVRDCTVVVPGHLRIELELATGRWGGFGPAERELLAPLGDVEFHHLPGPLSADLGFFRETRLADCRLATLDVLTRAAEGGVPARPAFGLLVARPFSAAHRWVELRDPDGAGWLCGDAFFVTALVRWGVLDAPGGPPGPPPRTPYWRLGDHVEPLVSHGGAPVRWSLLTR